jgi:hypothetical protein
MLEIDCPAAAPHQGGHRDLHTLMTMLHAI